MGSLARSKLGFTVVLEDATSNRDTRDYGTEDHRGLNESDCKTV